LFRYGVEGLNMGVILVVGTDLCFILSAVRGANFSEEVCCDSPAEPEVTASDVVGWGRCAK